MFKFKFNLQLFAEEGTTPEGDSGTAPIQEGIQTEGELSGGEQPEFAIVDGKLVINRKERQTVPVVPEGIAAPEGGQQTNEGHEGTAPAETAEPGDQMVSVTVNGLPVEVPLSELKNGYMRQQDYTQKTQSLAEQRRQAEALQAQNQQPQNQQQTQVAPENVARQYYEQMFTIAKGKAEENLGEPFDEFNALHQTALATEVANIKATMVQTQNAQQQLNYVTQPYLSDPEWDNIRSYASQVLDNMPYAQSNTIRQRIDSGDLAFLGDFLRTAKDEFNKAKNPQNQQTQTRAIPIKPKINPPILESGGGGVTATPQGKSINPKEDFRGKSTDQLAQMFAGMGLTGSKKR